MSVINNKDGCIGHKRYITRYGAQICKDFEVPGAFKDFLFGRFKKRISLSTFQELPQTLRILSILFTKSLCTL